VRDRALVLYAFRSRRGLSWDEAVALATSERPGP
jgi:hypothetical protein